MSVPASSVVQAPNLVPPNPAVLNPPNPAVLNPPNPAVLNPPNPLPALQHKNILNITIRTFNTSAALVDAVMNSVPLNNDNWPLIVPNNALWLVTAIKIALMNNNRTFDTVQRILLPPGFNMLEIRTPGEYNEATNTFNINTTYIRVSELVRRWAAFALSFMAEMYNSFDPIQRVPATHVLNNMLRVTPQHIEFGVLVPDF